MSNVKIANKIIGNGEQPFFIAEAGINHNGDLNKAYQMIEVAKAAGVDAIKFQTFKADEFISNSSLMYTYSSQGKKITESMLEMFRRYEFDPNEWHLIKKKCEQHEMTFLSTPQNLSDLELLLKIGVPAIKVGSDDFTNLFLLKQFVKTGLPLIISCGMANLAEVYQALDAIGSFDGYPTVLLLCTSQYPTQPRDVNLLKLKTLSAFFPQIILGFSDHTQGVLAASLAVALGATVFEKHFTLSHDLPGPDHWFSEDPWELKTWVENIRIAFKMLGSSLVRATDSENEMKMLARRSVAALCDIKQGDELNTCNVGLRRPGNGIQPVFFEKILGTKATKNISKNVLLKFNDFE